MSERTNTIMIGAFVLGAALIVISAILFISGGGWGGDRTKVVMVFDGSVKGLTIGAPIALRGVQVGQVTDIHLIFDVETIDVTTTVVAEIDSNNYETRGNRIGDFTEDLIERGLRAQLNSQSLLTGLLYIQLDFHQDSPIELADIDSPFTQIPTIPTDLQRISRELESMDFAGIAKDVQTIANSLGSFLETNAFQSLPMDFHNTLVSIQALSDQLNSQLITSGAKLDDLLEGGTDTINTFNNEFPKISAVAIETMQLLDVSVAAFGETMTEIDNLVSDDSATIYSLKRALREIALAGRELQSLAKTLEENPEALLRGIKEEKQ